MSPMSWSDDPPAISPNVLASVISTIPSSEKLSLSSIFESCTVGCMFVHLLSLVVLSDSTSKRYVYMYAIIWSLRQRASSQLQRTSGLWCEGSRFRRFNQAPLPICSKVPAPLTLTHVRSYVSLSPSREVSGETCRSSTSIASRSNPGNELLVAIHL